MTANRHEGTRSTRTPTGRLVRTSIVGAALVAGLVGAMAVPAGADEAVGATVANVGVLPGITMTGLDASFTLGGTPGATATGAGAVSFNVETNNVAGYAVTVQSRTETLEPTLVGNTDSIPIGDLKVREGADAYQDVSTDEVTVHVQDFRSENGGDDLANDYQIRVPVVNADTYHATLDYVATTL